MDQGFCLEENEKSFPKRSRSPFFCFSRRRYRHNSSVSSILDKILATFSPENDHSFCQLYLNTPSAGSMVDTAMGNSVQHFSGSVKKVERKKLCAPPEEIQQGVFLMAKCTQTIRIHFPRRRHSFLPTYISTANGKLDETPL